MQGIADKDNICIYGGSYGGYACLAGLTFTPDLYKCGVDIVGEIKKTGEHGCYSGNDSSEFLSSSALLFKVHLISRHC
jgi:dipeptidyl aminopeptidase/acylaminoacyl peptidase